jgi:competence protein ComEC
MGDASIEVEADVLTHLPNQKYDVLRIGHHGSLTSTSEVFLDSIQPNIAIISVSATNRYGHPHSSVMERLSTRGIETKRTDIDGTIVLKSCKI